MYISFGQKIIKLLIFLVLASCASEKADKPNKKLHEEFKEKRDTYCKLSKPLYDEKKFVVDECDGAGFTSLYATACPSNQVDLTVFQDELGRMHRSPNHKKCWDYELPPEQNIDKGSDAGYSKDHVLMRMIAAKEMNDSNWANRFYNFVNDKRLVFCDGKDLTTTLGKCVLSGGLYLNLRKLTNSFNITSESEDAVGVKDGFEGHLHVLSIWLSWRLNKTITTTDLGYVRDYARKEPMNALYQALAYRFQRSTEEQVKASFDNEHWPKDKLPNNHEHHCTEYLFQRDQSVEHDWKPCADREFKEHSGVDYTFAYYVLSAE